jgi:hypothetical protein
MLERARELYRDLTNEMHQYVEELNKKFQGLSELFELLIAPLTGLQSVSAPHRSFVSPLTTTITYGSNGVTSSESSRDN